MKSSRNGMFHSEWYPGLEMISWWKNSITFSGGSSREFDGIVLIQCLKMTLFRLDRRENISSELQVLQLWPRESISIVVSMFQNTNQVQYFKFIWLQYTYFIFTYSTYRFSRRSNKRLPTAASIAPHSSTQFGIIGIHEWNLQVSEAVRRRQRESLPTSLRSGGCALPLWRAPRSTPGSSSNQQGRADRL